MTKISRTCEHKHARKQIGLGADGKTYCADCGAERAPFSFLELVGGVSAQKLWDPRKEKRAYRKAALAERRAYLATKADGAGQ